MTVRAFGASLAAMVLVMPLASIARTIQAAQYDPLTVFIDRRGKVAYIHLPNTQLQGIQEFSKQYYPQVDKQGLIVDERFNGGGQVADYYIDLLKRPLISYWAMRYGDVRSTDTTATPRILVGVVKHADSATSPGIPTGAFSELHRSPGGDPRGSSQNNLVGEFLGAGNGIPEDRLWLIAIAVMLLPT